MVNYQNGKIYKIEPICEHEENEIYIGLTTKKYLSQRMEKHRSDYKSFLEGKTNNVTSFDLFGKFGVENCKIILLENYPCNTINELLAKEGYYIRTLKCVNRCVSGRTRKQYNIDNSKNNKKYC